LPTYGELDVERQDIERKAKGNPALTRKLAPVGLLRKKYVEALSAKTNRTTFIYYSGFLQTPQGAPSALLVGGLDMTGFMEVCSNVTDSKELDLFLHSPGGDGEAVDQICAYLRSQFDHIRAIVPVYAMSAGTMLALGADEILMGAHSQLGPIDPQMTIQTNEGPRSASAEAIKEQFEMAVKECEDPNKVPAWLPILRSYAPGLLATCDAAAARAKEIVQGSLREYMFAGETEAAKKAKSTADWFGNAKHFLSHGRPVRRDEAREHGIKVQDLEDDGDLQDAVLSVHHAAMISMANVPILKVIENNRDRRFLQVLQAIQIEMPGPGAGPATPAAPPGGKKPPPPPPRRRKAKKH
jgi:hypothetical protein